MKKFSKVGMVIDTKKLLEAQRFLRSRIEEQHPNTAKENRSKLRIVANIVEMSEAFNEERSFKFWSTRREPTEHLLEEFIDSLHFFLETAIDYGWENVLHSVADAFNEVHNPDDNKVSVDYFLEIVYNLSAIEVEQKSVKYFTNAWVLYLGLGQKLGFTGEQIEAAYFKKNHVNLERQNTGY